MSNIGGTPTPLARAQERKDYVENPIEPLAIEYGLQVRELVVLIGRTEKETAGNIELFRKTAKLPAQTQESPNNKVVERNGIEMGKTITPQGKEVKTTENIRDLTEKMVQTFDELFTGIIDEATAVARAKAANSICSLLKTQLVYNKITGQCQDIKFLKDPNMVEAAKDNN